MHATTARPARTLAYFAPVVVVTADHVTDAEIAAAWESGALTWHRDMPSWH